MARCRLCQSLIRQKNANTTNLWSHLKSNHPELYPPPIASAAAAAVVAEQQRALVQQVIAKLTEVSFDTCLQKKPDSTLSAGERACIHTVVGKYLDTSEFVLGRSTKKAQQSQMLS